MEENQKETDSVWEPSSAVPEKKGGKKKLFLLLIIILVLTAVGVTVFLWYRSKDDDDDSGRLGYEKSAVVVTDQDELQKMVDEMEASKGKISLEYKNIAKSSNGSDFDCYIANSARNTGDMYIGIYTDATYAEELYLTQLMKPGSGITTFTCNKKMEPGRHEVVLVFTLVEDDHKSIRTQTSVTYSLVVDEQAE